MWPVLTLKDVLCGSAFTALEYLQDAQMKTIPCAWNTWKSIWEEDEEYLSNSTSLVKTCEKSNSNDNDTDKYTDTDTDTAN